ncbi:MAG: electron transport complex subunit RsxB [Aquimonas sp.]|jgi:electron transport complex protein RnfB
MSGLVAFVLLSLALGALLGWAAQRFRVDEDPVVERINALLPQTQCGQCNYPGCRPYAEAIARGEADINQCPPGGEAGVRALAELLGREAKPLSASHGIEQPPRVAFILEELCIGCVKCIQACPVDAIVGAPKRMHTVIAELCTGCDLCLPPCPVDCIEMRPLETPKPEWRSIPLTLRT